MIALPHSDVRKRKSKLRRVLFWILSVILLISAVVYLSFQLSPWPSVLLIRYSFQKEGRIANERLGKYVPKGIGSLSDILFDSTYGKTKLDLYYPGYSIGTNTKYPLVIWVHGGGFVAGDKNELTNYCKILASNGYIVAAPNYSLAPGEKYPVPLVQINRAVAFLVQHADKFNIDTSCIVAAGDSGGAHIVAQLANIFADSTYAVLIGVTPLCNRGILKGVILYCGPYNTDLVNFEGSYGWFLRTVLWSYTGRKDFTNDPKFRHFSVANFVSDKFPRTFISVGNKDPLSPHSHDLASKLSSQGVIVDSLFFPNDYSPGLPHEYQFNLDIEAGKLALEKTIHFLSSFKPK